MKTLATIATAILILGFSLGADAQTRVTGRVFAEVVELTGAESNTRDFVEVKGSDLDGGFDLGEISFRGRANTAFEVVFTSNSLKGNNGSEASFEARTEEGTTSARISENGSQVVRLRGNTAEDIFAAHDRQYAGQYQVVFAYN